MSKPIPSSTAAGIAEFVIVLAESLVVLDCTALEDRSSEIVMRHLIESLCQREDDDSFPLGRGASLILLETLYQNLQAWKEYYEAP